MQSVLNGSLPSPDLLPSRVNYLKDNKSYFFAGGHLVFDTEVIKDISIILLISTMTFLTFWTWPI